MVLASILALVMASSFACSKTEESKPQKPIIAVSIVPQETFVRAVCGDMWDIVVMVPPGYSPESHEPLPKDIEKFHQASLFFTIGVPIESANLLEEAKKVPSMSVIPLHKKVAEFYSEKEFSPGERDPHIWLSPKRVMLMVQNIKKIHYDTWKNLHVLTKKSKHSWTHWRTKLFLFFILHLPILRVTIPCKCIPWKKKVKKPIPTI